MPSMSSLSSLQSQSRDSTANTSSKFSTKDMLKMKDKKIAELESLIQTISRGKYMWESTFDAITDPVMIVSSDYQILRVNLAAANAAEVDVRDMIGRKCFQTLGGFEKPCRGCPLHQTIDSRKPNSSTLDSFRNNQCQYHVNAYSLGSEGGQEQVILYYRDITEEKKLHSQLLQSEKMAAVGTLAGGVAHEINNPLGGVLAFVQLAMRGLSADHPVQKDLKEIEEATLRCKRIVQDLLDFSRYNREEDVMEPVQVNEVFKKIIPLIQLQTKTNHVQLICHWEEPLPLIQGNVHKLQQVFLNLVTNALQSMKSRGKLTLTTSIRENKNKVCVEVTDTGEGIPKNQLGKIFDPYFTTKKQGDGTGLGLSISYGIVEEHHGKIEVESKEGKGTTFYVLFPTVS